MGFTEFQISLGSEVKNEVRPHLTESVANRVRIADIQPFDPGSAGQLVSGKDGMAALLEVGVDGVAEHPPAAGDQDTFGVVFPQAPVAPEMWTVLHSLLTPGVLISKSGYDATLPDFQASLYFGSDPAIG